MSNQVVNLKKLQKQAMKAMTNGELSAYMRACQNGTTEFTQRQFGLAQEEWIQRLAEAGAAFSKYMRTPFADDPSPRVSAKSFEATGKMNLIRCIAWISISKPLLAVEDIADLYQIAPGRPDQHKWDKKRWAKEIRRMLR